MDSQEIKKELQHVANPEEALKMKAYMKHQFEFLGVKTPVRRTLEKQLFSQELQESIDWKFIDEAWACTYREMQYVVLDYLQWKKYASVVIRQKIL